jgi:poly-beta-hydroxyalkanoate depolymerase
VGAGRDSYDGRAHVLGFYFLGKEQHMRNFRKLLLDLRSGNTEAAERQKVFYPWYNTVNHLPGDFLRDTFKKIFVRNELARGTLTICGRRISLKDYPGSVPIWSLGGRKDDFTPPLQATGHMGLIRSVSERDKLLLLCEAGHMGLFRSSEILKNYYSRIVDFMLARSDMAQPEVENSSISTQE